MDIPAYLAIVTLLIFSFLIAVLPRLRRPHKSELERLYKGNKWGLALGSNAGTILSLSTYPTSSIVLSYWQGITSLLIFELGIIIGFGMLLIITTDNKVFSFFHQAKEHNLERNRTFSSFIGSTFGNKTKILINMMIIAYLIVFFSAELGLFRLWFNSIVPDFFIPSWLLTYFLIAICAIYVIVGGYIGVLRTDVLQLGVMSISFLVFAIFAVQYIGIDGLKMIFNFSNLEIHSRPSLLIGGLILGPGFFLVSPDNWIRTVGTLRKKSDLRKCLIGSIILVGLFGILPFAVGIWIRLMDKTLRPEFWNIPFQIFNNIIFLSETNLFIAFLVILLLGCAVLTTIDTFLITLGQTMFDAGLCTESFRHTNIYRPTVSNAIIFVSILSLIISFSVSIDNYTIFALLVASYYAFLLPFLVLCIFLPKHCNDNVGYNRIIMAIIMSSLSLIIGAKRFHLQIFNVDSPIAFLLVFSSTVLSILLTIVVNKQRGKL